MVKPNNILFPLQGNVLAYDRDSRQALVDLASFAWWPLIVLPLMQYALAEAYLRFGHPWSRLLKADQKKR